MNPLAGLSSLAVINFPGKMEEPPSPRTIRTSQEEKLSTSLLQSNSEERGILPTFTGPHQGTAAGNSLRFSFGGRLPTFTGPIREQQPATHPLPEQPENPS
ncbi:hypothetical protein [Prevotella denticola]|uniref:hypothetical protein n=1 Tax=Prevotella denticola TaxID=28129 RepID=UPI000201306E|nr:hypothetical protein [Prevotella denticola]AEA21932.1 hypothetical protein HMPREF9137_1975 [Prevotella denticola F0289]MBW4899113.1 hypothetical protein [Prevotella denticola]QUB89430.1 hypothetical protein J4860_11410 [Prevotella denticola]